MNGKQDFEDLSKRYNEEQFLYLELDFEDDIQMVCLGKGYEPKPIVIETE